MLRSRSIVLRFGAVHHLEVPYSKAESSGEEKKKVKTVDTIVLETALCRVYS